MEFCFYFPPSVYIYSCGMAGCVSARTDAPLKTEKLRERILDISPFHQTVDERKRYNIHRTREETTPAIYLCAYVSTLYVPIYNNIIIHGEFFVVFTHFIVYYVWFLL